MCNSACAYTYVFQIDIYNFMWCNYIRSCLCVMKLFYSKQEGRSPLHIAAEKSHTDIVIILITHGANVDSVRNSTYYYNQLQVFGLVV